MAFWDKKPEDPAQDVKDRVKKLERENEQAVKMDHRFGVLGVLVVAIAALIGMSFEAVQALLKGNIGQGDTVQLATALGAIFVMNRALLAAARNIRRAESRGEEPRQRDHITMYGVMAIESVSFAYMLWLFEGKPDMLSVPGFLLAARAGVLPYATVYLEQQRQQPPDPVDISVQAEIGQGLGVMGDLVTQAYDRTLPTALKLNNYRANATLTDKMDARLKRMTHAAHAYDHFKETGEILEPDEVVDPSQRGPKPQDNEAQNDEADQDNEGQNLDEVFGALDYTMDDPRLAAYVLPGTATLVLNGTKGAIAKLLGIKRVADIGEAMRKAHMEPAGRISGQGRNASNVLVAQILALVDRELLPLPEHVTKRPPLSLVQ